MDFEIDEIEPQELKRLTAIEAAAKAMFDQKVSPDKQSPPFEKWLALHNALRGDICGHVGTTRCGKVTAVCQLPRGHSGKHGGMGCEWS